ncbi:hypothetical protein ACFSYD_18260 [Paracoccus aerius]
MRDGFDFQKVRRGNDDTHALPGQPAHLGIDLGLGADIHALGRLDEDHHAIAVGRTVKPLPDRDLLFVAARQLAQQLARGMCLDVHQFHDAASLGLLAPG